jgi:hypothetical protein
MHCSVRATIQNQGPMPHAAQVASSAFYQTGSSDRMYAWGAQPCSARFAAICAVPKEAFPCNPPPSPPPVPPPPPSPPAPPLDTACAPRTSANFYCDAQLLLCFNLTTQAVMFDAAQANCQSMGMTLVKLDSAAKQLNVEKFFR